MEDEEESDDDDEEDEEEQKFAAALRCLGRWVNGLITTTATLSGHPKMDNAYHLGMLDTIHALDRVPICLRFQRLLISLLQTLSGLEALEGMGPREAQVEAAQRVIGRWLGSQPDSLLLSPDRLMEPRARDLTRLARLIS